jgi:hypothetical protein
MRRIIIALTLVASLSAVAAVQTSRPVNKLFVGLGYVAAKRGASPARGAYIGFAGWGATTLIGATYGGPYGLVAGAAVGL